MPYFSDWEHIDLHESPNYNSSENLTLIQITRAVPIVHEKKIWGGKSNSQLQQQQLN